MPSVPVDVLVPVFNDRAGLARAIESVRKQTVKPNCLIIVDDGSKLAIEPTKIDFGFPVIVDRLIENRGPSAARNHAIRRSDAEYIALLDSDDEWLPNKLELQYEFLKQQETENSGILACVTGFHISGGYGLGSPDGGRDAVPVGASSFSDFSGGCWHCPGSTLLIKRQAILDCGLYNESIKRLEDFDFFLRFADAGGELVVCEEVLSKIYVKRDDRRELPLNSINRILSHYIGEDKKYSAESQNKIRAYLYLEIAAQSYRRRDIFNAIKYMTMSLFFKPRTSLYVGDFWKIV